jgi:hypothetical protein
MLSLKPSEHEEDELMKLNNFLQSWKTSKNEFFFLSYRAVVGALAVTFLGLTMLPALRMSPYISRKVFNRLSSNDIFPVDNAKFLLGTIAPYFAFVGAFAGAGGTFLSEAFDRAFCCNIAVKYGVLGALDGMLLCMFFGPVGSWTNGLIGGGILGLSYLGFQGIVRPYSHGDFGNRVVYFGGVTEEEKKRYLVQEERLGVNYIDK